jgi:preprotein translocase subunit SecE
MFDKIRHGLQLTTDELVNKVTWPTAEELQSSAIVVLVASVLIALVIFGVDSGLELIFTQFYKIFR